MPLSESTLQSSAAVSMLEYTRHELIVPHLRETDTAGIIGQLSEGLQRQRVVPDLLPFYHAALNQELLHNSALESGIAIPHARLTGVKHVQFSFGRTAFPVSWGVKGSWAVQFIFLVAVPASDSATYLQLLAGIARLSQQPELIAELRKATGAEDLLAVFERVRLRPR